MESSGSNVVTGHALPDASRIPFLSAAAIPACDHWRIRHVTGQRAEAFQLGTASESNTLMKARAILGLSRFTTSLHIDRIGRRQATFHGGFCHPRLAPGQCGPTEVHPMEYMAAQMDRQIEGAQHRYDDALKEGEQPAFPVAASEYGGHGTCFGLTIRDYFAAKAMQGWSANPIPQDSSIQEVAEWAYRQADAMLAARVKP